MRHASLKEMASHPCARTWRQLEATSSLSDPSDVPQLDLFQAVSSMSTAVLLANIVATACVSVLVFVVAGGAWFLAFSSLIWSFTVDTTVSYAAGAVTGVLFGGLVATPLVQRLLRLMSQRSRGHR